MENCKNTCQPCTPCNNTTAPVDETQKYYEGLKRENEQLKNQLKVTEEDRDQSKQDVQKMVGEYLKLYAEHYGKSIKEVQKDFAKRMSEILKR